MISATIALQVQFYDVDPMNVVWHGHYARFFEQARCALLERIGYSYDEMAQSGHLWPIVDMRCKFVRPARFKQTLAVTATLLEYENRLRIGYLVQDQASGETLTKAETTQLAVLADRMETCLESPAVLIEKVRRCLGR